jgi:hypothetical protein
MLTARHASMISLLVGSWSASGLVHAGVRESGIQITPDVKHVLVNKDVATSRYVIVQDRDDRSVTGNVFFTDGSSPTFLFCSSEGGSTFACSGAESCPNPGRESGIQRRPDGKGVLVSKDVAGSRFAITQNGDGTLTGNVFFTDGRSPQFLWCTPTGGNGYACSGSERCGEGACPGYDFIANVTLPEGFFAVPAGCPAYGFIAEVPLPATFFSLPGTANEQTAEIFGALVKVQGASGAEATLVRGEAPAPDDGAARTINGADARLEGFDGARLVIPVATAANAPSPAASGPDALIVAAAREDGSLMEGYYELPLTGSATEEVGLTFAGLTKIPLIRLATRVAGVVSPFEATLVSITLTSDTPLLGFQVRAHYPSETGAFIGAADHVSCRIPALDVGIFTNASEFCQPGDRVSFLANNLIDAGELVLQVVSCNVTEPSEPDFFLPFPIEIVCGFAAAPGRALVPATDITVTVDEVVVDRDGAVTGDPTALGVTTGLAVRQ